MKDINLLLEEDKNVLQGESTGEKSFNAAGKIAAALVVIGIASLAIAAPIFYDKAMDLKLDSIQNQLKSEKYQEVQSVKTKLVFAQQKLEDKESIIGCIDEQGYPVNDILNTLRNNTPKGCEINDIQYDTNALRLGVKTEEITNVAELLLNIDRLSKIRLSENSNTIKINSNGEYVFNLEVGQREVD